MQKETNKKSKQTPRYHQNKPGITPHTQHHSTSQIPNAPPDEAHHQITLSYHAPPHSGRGTPLLRADAYPNVSLPPAAISHPEQCTHQSSSSSQPPTGPPCPSTCCSVVFLTVGGVCCSRDSKDWDLGKGGIFTGGQLRYHVD